MLNGCVKDKVHEMQDLRVSENCHYLCTADGKPFFWLGNTCWLLPQKTTREDVDLLLDRTEEEGYNVIQVQVLNGVPSTNAYGRLSNGDDFDFSFVDGEGADGYWQHIDYIVDAAAKRGIYVGMVCIWGGLVKNGLMDIEQAGRYGRFLAERFRDEANIVWIIGGDIKGDIKPEVWNALAKSIKAIDDRHLMTFHPFGRTSSVRWFNDAEWLDFNMFQSGHRRYDQIRGDGDDLAQASVAEDNWRYVQEALDASVTKPVLDGEPVYEDIPQGLHDFSEPRWTADDCRRYAWWSVLAGSMGHTYGHNSIMQFHDGNGVGAYGAQRSWREALEDPGFAQMKYVKQLMDRFNSPERVPAQDLVSDNGERYERVAVSSGPGFILAYTYTNSPFVLDCSSVPEPRTASWYSTTDGTYSEPFEIGPDSCFQYPGPVGNGNDHVLVITTATAGGR